MNAVDFVSKVREMRVTQKPWFKNHLRGDLIKSKQLEAEVDFALKEGVTLLETNIGMFDADGNEISPVKQWGWNDDIAVQNELNAPDLDA